MALDELLLVPGERAEVLVAPRGAGEFRLLNLPYDRGSGSIHGGGHGTAQPDDAGEPLMTISVGQDLPFAGLPRRLPSEVEKLEDVGVDRRFDFGGGGHGGHMAFTINGRTFDENRTDVRGHLGDTEVWELRNRSTMDHPFHLHTYPFQVLSRSGRAESIIAWKDVVNLRAGESVRIAVPLRDFTGRTVFHCHIVEHEDLGMVGVLEV